MNEQELNELNEQLQVVNGQKIIDIARKNKVIIVSTRTHKVIFTLEREPDSYVKFYPLDLHYWGIFKDCVIKEELCQNGMLESDKGIRSFLYINNRIIAVWEVCRYYPNLVIKIQEKQYLNDRRYLTDDYVKRMWVEKSDVFMETEYEIYKFYNPEQRMKLLDFKSEINLNLEKVNLRTNKLVTDLLINSPNKKGIAKIATWERTGASDTIEIVSEHIFPKL